MKSFDVEIAVGFNASLTVESETKEEAIKFAIDKVLNNPLSYYDGNIEVNEITYVNQIKGGF